MNETDRLNALFFSLFNHNGGFKKAEFFSSDTGIALDLAKRSLDTLARTKYVSREIVPHTNHFGYEITSEGLLFVEDVPNERHKELFSVFIEKKNKKKAKKQADRKIQLDAISSSNETNQSIQLLNRQTKIFYKQQRTNNEVQKWLTFVIFLSSAAYTFITWYAYDFPKKTGTPGIDVESLKRSLKDQILKDSLFRIELRNSLKNVP